MHNQCELLRLYKQRVNGTDARVVGTDHTGTVTGAGVNITDTRVIGTDHTVTVTEAAVKIFDQTEVSRTGLGIS